MYKGCVCIVAEYNGPDKSAIGYMTVTDNTTSLIPRIMVGIFDFIVLLCFLTALVFFCKAPKGGDSPVPGIVVSTAPAAPAPAYPLAAYPASNVYANPPPYPSSGAPPYPSSGAPPSATNWETPYPAAPSATTPAGPSAAEIDPGPYCQNEKPPVPPGSEVDPGPYQYQH